MADRPRYISANLTPDVAIALRQLVGAMASQCDRRVTTSDLLGVLVEIGSEQQSEVLDRLQKAR